MPRDFMPIDPASIRSLYSRGYTMQEVATALGVSWGTVLRHMRRHGIRRRRPGQLPIRHHKLTDFTADELRGLAGWLRGAAGARSRVELASSTAVLLAELLEAAVGHEQRGAT